MIEHHVIIAKMLKERLESKSQDIDFTKSNEEKQIKSQDKDFKDLDQINKEDLVFKTANKVEFKFVDNSEEFVDSNVSSVSEEFVDSNVSNVSEDFVDSNVSDTQDSENSGKSSSEFKFIDDRDDFSY